MYRVFRLIGVLIICFVGVSWWVEEKQDSTYQKQVDQIIDEVFFNDIQENINNAISASFDNDICAEELKNNVDVTMNYLDLEEISEPYLGYISFPEYSVRRLIVSGATRDIFDQGLVGMFVTSASLDSDVGNVILAGHSVDSVFQTLHNIKIGEDIQIGSYVDVYTYRITHKYYIRDDDFSYFDEVCDRKILTLITCTKNEHERLIVQAELVR